jgi:hypothetical protein
VHYDSDRVILIFIDHRQTGNTIIKLVRGIDVCDVRELIHACALHSVSRVLHMRRNRNVGAYAELRKRVITRNTLPSDARSRGWSNKASQIKNGSIDQSTLFGQTAKMPSKFNALRRRNAEKFGRGVRVGLQIVIPWHVTSFMIVLQWLQSSPRPDPCFAVLDGFHCEHFRYRSAAINGATVVRLETVHVDFTASFIVHADEIAYC